MTQIKTKRLTLKKPSQADKLAFVEGLNNLAVSGTLSKVPYPYTMSDADWWLDNIKDKPLNLNIFLENKLIGGIALDLEEDGFYEFGFWLAEAYWGKGYATEAGRSLLDYAFKTVPEIKIKSGYFESNRASANALEKLGFYKVGDGFSHSKAQGEKKRLIKLHLRK